MGRRRYFIIYKAKNTIENKFYVGQTSFTFSSRKATHKRKALILNKKSPFYDAIRKYGWEAFEWDIVCYCENQEELDLKEEETMNLLGKENCYNSQTGGKTKYMLSDKQKQDISNRMKGKNNHQYGKKRTEDEMKKCKEASLEICSKKVIRIKDNKIYNSISDCARENNCAISTISLHCNNKIKTPKYRFL